MKLSVVIPAYNKPDKLYQLIESLKNNKTSFEIIISDDCSPDPSMNDRLDMLSSILPKHIKLLVIKNTKNTGIAENTNIGIRHAKGEYVCLIDDDDYLREDAIDILIKNLNQYSPDWGFTNRFDVKEFQIPDMQIYGNQLLLKEIQIHEALLFDMFASHLKFYKCNVFNELGFFDAAYNYAIDYDMALRLAWAKKKYLHIDDTLYYHNISSKQTTQTMWLEQVHQANELRIKYLSKFRTADFTHAIYISHSELDFNAKFSIVFNDKSIKSFILYHEFKIALENDNCNIKEVILYPTTILPKLDLLYLYKITKGNTTLIYASEYNTNATWYQFYASFFTTIVCHSPAEATLFSLSAPSDTKIRLFKDWNKNEII